jgi:hypothetical protein
MTWQKNGFAETADLSVIPFFCHSSVMLLPQGIDDGDGFVG